MPGNLKANLGQKATSSNAVSMTATQGMFLILFGFILMLVMTPDGIVVYEFTADLMRDDGGNLSAWENILAIITAVTTMLTIALVIHWAYEQLSANVTNRIYLWLGLIALLVVLVQPLMVMLRDADFGGNSFDTEAADQSLGGWVLFFATLARVGVFPLYAIVGTVGLGMVLKGWNVWRTAKDAKADSLVQHQSMRDINEGEKIAKMARHELEKKARKMRMSVADMLHTAANDMAMQCQFYLTGAPSTLTQASFLQSVDQMVRASEGPNTEALAQVVKMHLPEALPLNVLPVDGRTLPDAAKREIQGYIKWIRTNYRRRHLLEVI